MRPARHVPASRAPLLMLLLSLPAFFALIATGCGSSNGTSTLDTSSPSTTSSAATTSSISSTTVSFTAGTTATSIGSEAQVTIQNYTYEPAELRVKVGDTVTWTNRDSIQHNAAADDGTSFKGPLLSTGESSSFTFEKAGTFPYHCDPHPFMKATIIVE